MELTAFYAYSDKPASRAETIEEAIDLINNTKVVDALGWREMANTGTPVINRICREIEKRDVFLADLSGLNSNVLFELGFAVGRHKRVWLTLDVSNKENVDLLKSLTLLRGIGYAGYVNDDDIYRRFLSEKPYETLDENLFSAPIPTSEKPKDIFYLKNRINHMASRKLTKWLKDLNRTMLMDDPGESVYQPLSWYLQNICSHRLVIVHLLRDTDENSKLWNAHYSFLAGIAHGLKKKMLMLAPDPFSAPFDYQDLMYIHHTAKSCLERVEEWITPFLIRGEKPPKRPDKDETRSLVMLRVRLGDGVAENEEDDLSSYFVETAQYEAGLEESMAVFTGRKGTGKTANLYRIRDRFSYKNGNFVVVIKPLSFKLESYVKLIETHFPTPDLSIEVTETIWKFLIYSEISRKLYDQLADKPSYFDPSAEQTAFLTYIKEHEETIFLDFDEKLDSLHQFVDDMTTNPAYSTKKQVINVLYKEYISTLVTLLKKVLEPYQKIIILVDNLDKAWSARRDTEAQCHIVHGLLGFQNTMARELKWKKSDVRLLVFLREDIFDKVVLHAREPDKVQFMRRPIVWNDEQLLMRVIEERFMAYDSSLSSSAVWKKYFCTEVDGLPARDYIFRHIMPRPRDLVRLLHCAIGEAINHDHDMVEAEDIKKAMTEYFAFLLENTVTESELREVDLRSLILSFLGSPAELTLTKVIRKIRRFETDRFSRKQIIEALVGMSFLGIEVSGEFMFADDKVAMDKILAQIHDRSLEGIFQYFDKTTFAIHPAFRIGLEIQ